MTFPLHNTSVPLSENNVNSVHHSLNESLKTDREQKPPLRKLNQNTSKPMTDEMS